MKKWCYVLFPNGLLILPAVYCTVEEACDAVRAAGRYPSVTRENDREAHIVVF